MKTSNIDYGITPPSWMWVVFPGRHIRVRTFGSQGQFSDLKNEKVNTGIFVKISRQIFIFKNVPN